MDIRAGQQGMQATFLRGSVGQAVSGGIWLVSAALATWGNQRAAIVFLVLAGSAIYPLTQLGLRLLGRPAGLPKGHPLNALAMEIAFIVPFCLPLIGAAALYNVNWFYPAFMLVVGVHYMPFIFLYGMWEFGVLAALLIGGGVAIGMLLPHSFSVGGWVGAAALLAFAALVQVMPSLSKSAAADRSS
jgi:hypothetical protein